MICPPARSSSIGWKTRLADNAPIDSGKRIEGHFTIQRIEPRQIWLEPMLSDIRQNISVPVPAAIAKACKIGWDIGGAVAENGQGLAIGRGLEPLPMKIHPWISVIPLTVLERKNEA